MKSNETARWPKQKTYERGERFPSALCWATELLSLEEVGEAFSVTRREFLELGVTT